jgi:hypothetical protein
MTNTAVASRPFVLLSCDQVWADEDGETSPCYADAVLHVHSAISGQHVMCVAHAVHFPNATKFRI